MDEIKSKLFYEPKNGYDLIDAAEHIAVEDYCSGYMEFLNASRTEREAVANAIAMAKENGFVEFHPGMELRPGTKVYYCNRGKALILAVIGKHSLSGGAVIAGAHVDAPRVDLKQNPMYETDELCYFRTHYYGGSLSRLSCTASPCSRTALSWISALAESRMSRALSSPTCCRILRRNR